MIARVGKIPFKRIKRISPSQFSSMKNCAYKSLLAEAFEQKPLLPVSANAHFGTVLHKLLELIAKDIVKTEEELNSAFEREVKLVEDNLKRLGYDFFIPLQKNVRDFGIKIILLRKHLSSVSAKPTSANDIKFHSEKWFESIDKSIAGKIDLIVETGRSVEIVDFKTGAITEDILDDAGETFSEIKEEYKDQLKLYAYLFLENTGQFPAQLSLVDLAKQKFIVNSSQSECKSLFEEAKQLLDTTNKSILNESFEANPTEANCKYCLYRPACSFFIKSLEINYMFNDVSGLVRNVVKYQNGNVSLFLECSFSSIK